MQNLWRVTMKKLLITSIIICIVSVCLWVHLNITALAKNIYFEARNSIIEDQIATAVVVMNRGYPAVEVYKPSQFSWTSEYKTPAYNKSYKKAVAIAKMVFFNLEEFQSKDICKHYTTTVEYPKGHWTHKFKRRIKIGKHYYYCN